jgi:cytosine permease
MTVEGRDEKSESFAHSTVPADATGSAAKIFFIVAGSLCGLPVFVLSSGITAGVGFRAALWVFIVGTTVAATLGAASALSGARTRMSLAILAEATFGVWGARLVQLAIALSLFGWFGVIVSVLGATAANGIQQVWGFAVPSPAISLPLCVLITFIARRGVDGLERLGAILVPLTFILLLIAVGMTASALSRAAFDHGSGATTFGAGVSAVIGGYIVGIIIQPDYGRFVRSPGRAAFAAFAALGIAYPLILCLSAMPSLALGKSDLIAALIALGIGLPALALLLMGAWIDASMCLYSGSLALAKLLPGLRFRNIVLGGGVVGMLFALGHMERQFMPFLQLLGVTLPPVAAVQCVTALWPENAAVSARPPQLIRLGALGSWVIGIAVGAGSARIGLSITGIAAVDSIVGAGVAAIAFRLLALSRTRSIAQQAGL